MCIRDRDMREECINNPIELMWGKNDLEDTIRNTEAEK